MNRVEMRTDALSRDESHGDPNWFVSTRAWTERHTLGKIEEN